jgi:HK97 family phage major capsid protein
MPETKEQVVEELKGVFEGQLKPLLEQISEEKKARGELSDETKAIEKRIDDEMDRIEARFQKLVMDEKKDADKETSEAKTAFFGWCRKDRQGVPAELIEKKALILSDDTSVGALVPVEYDKEIIKGVVEFSPLRDVARVSTTGAQSLRVVKRTGTFAARWAGENEPRTETTGLGYSVDEIPNHELYATVDISNQALEDEQYDLEGELYQEFTEQFGVAEGAAFVAGNAVKKPEGFLTNTNVTKLPTLVNDAFSAVDVIELYFALKTPYAMRGTWAMNRQILKAIRKFQDNQGNYLWQPGLAGLAPATILDQPYIRVIDMANAVVDQALILAFGDWQRAYRIVDRIGMTVQRDPYTQADNGMTRFRARKRVGGQVLNPEAIPITKVQ